MPLNRLANEAGVYRPEELQLLGSVFDKLAKGEADTAGREALASRIISYYMAGIRDENELLALSKLPLRR